MSKKNKGQQNQDNRNELFEEKENLFEDKIEIDEKEAETELNNFVDEYGIETVATTEATEEKTSEQEVGIVILITVDGLIYKNDLGENIRLYGYDYVANYKKGDTIIVNK